MLKGFDFSHWNGDKQFFPFSKDCDFLFHKITESTSYVDPKCKVRIKDVKIPFGLYHLIRPDKNTTYSGEAEHFTHYIDELRRDGYRFGIALDIEQGYVPYDSPTSKLEWIEGMVKYLFDRWRNCACKVVDHHHYPGGCSPCGIYDRADHDAGKRHIFAYLYHFAYFPYRRLREPAESPEEAAFSCA